MNRSDIFDQAVYDGLVAELGSEDTAEVLRTFLADTAGKLDRLRAGSVDRETARRESHAIKSSAATFGFLELSRRAKDLEKSAPAMSAEGLDAAVDELQQRFAQVRDLAENLLRVQSREIAR